MKEIVKYIENNQESLITGCYEFFCLRGYLEYEDLSLENKVACIKRLDTFEDFGFDCGFTGLLVNKEYYPLYKLTEDIELVNKLVSVQSITIKEVFCNALIDELSRTEDFNNYSLGCRSTLD